MHVIATAGHVDHGKSTLVRALTGMEPDRWAEERRRGLTIDLGYAWTTLPSGPELAFVDVPGHQRFIGNMLAGLGPVTAVLFVVAADEGWCAQSEEHLVAADALGLRHGLLAVTRSDLADPGPALEQAGRRIARTGLGPVEAVAVSGATGAGLDALRAGLDRLVAQLPRPDHTAPVRLWVDRSFTVRGSGTVVTGTLAAGTVAVGDRLELYSRPVLVRGLHALGQAHDRVPAVARVAVNLRGVARGEVGRGDVLVTPGAWPWTSILDVRLDRELPDPADLILHVGTAARPVRLRPLGGRHVRLTLDAPEPIRAGDRAILRDPGRQELAAGVLVLDADPPALARRGAPARRAAELDAATGVPDAVHEVTRRGAVRRQHLIALGVPLDDLGDVRAFGDWLVARRTWHGWVAALPGALDAWRADSPLDAGAPLDALRQTLDVPDRELLKAVVAEAGLAVHDGRVVRPGQAVSLGASSDAVDTVRSRLEQAPFAAPERHELDELGLGRRELAAAERAGRLLRISDEIVLLPSAAGRAVEALRELPQPFTTSQARRALSTTRRVAVPLLEYLDAQGLTERVDQLTRRVL